MLSKLAVKRLTRLADYMESLPDAAREHFYMGCYFKHEGDHAIPKGPIKNLMDCGTKACALGWATSCFARQGLQMRPQPKAPLWTEFRIGKARWTTDSDDVSMKFFDLENVADSDELFGAITEITTPKQWARMCRRFIRKNS